MSNEWRFEMLDPPSWILKLNGYSAPFGRPRQKPVVSDTLKVRQGVTRYPDSVLEPTRHILGPARDAFEISGRWMDRKLGKGQAADLVHQFEMYVNYQVRSRVSWGDVSSWVGLLSELDAKWESDSEVAWTLKFEVDSKDGDTTLRKLPNLDHQARVSQINIAVENIQPPARIRTVVTTDLFDAIDNLISVIAGYTAAFNKIANQIQNLESAFFADLERLRGAIHQLKTGVLKFENLCASVVADTALFARSAESDIYWFAYQRQTSMNNNVIVAILADLERDVELAQVGKTQTAYIAKSGDTWEKIAIHFYGNPDGAAKIRAANGIKFGLLPIPGKKYRIPLQ